MIKILKVAVVFMGLTAVFSSDVYAKQKVKVFILAGQSNAVGYNHINEYKGDKEVVVKNIEDATNVIFWAGSNAREGYSNCWKELQIGVSDISSDGGYKDGCFGPEIGFGIAMSKMMPNQKIAIIKYAVGGTGIARSSDYSDYIPALAGFDDKGNNWNPGVDGKEEGNLYKALTKNIKDALAALGEDNDYEICGFMWMQGEHEAGISRKMASDYADLLSMLREAIRKELKSKKLPFVVGEINSHTWAFAELGREKQLKACQEDSYSVLVKTTDIPRDGIGDLAHFNANGMITLGQRFAEGFVSLGK